MHVENGVKGRWKGAQCSAVFGRGRSYPVLGVAESPLAPDGRDSGLFDGFDQGRDARAQDVHRKWLKDRRAATGDSALRTVGCGPAPLRPLAPLEPLVPLVRLGCFVAPQENTNHAFLRRLPESSEMRRVGAALAYGETRQ